jgi:NAD(P) transhydrogenase subunit alpha
MTNVWIPCAERGERRVAATPETVRRMTEADIHVRVDAGAGAQAHFTDDDYREAGAEIGSRPPDGGSADLVLTVNGLPKEKLSEIGRGAVLIGFLDPLRDAERARALAGAGISALAMELIPRITRAQPMDALSSQASLAGYKATVLAAARLDRYFPLLMTAAGTIPPSRVVVMGAGVAGLQAIATAKRLGAVVEVSDIRPAVQEQVESLGGRFIERQAPVLLTCEMVERMRPGAVVVDLAVSQGGNCELARADEEIEHEGVLIIGATNLARDTPHDASVLFARNVYSLAELVLQDGAVQLDLDDEIVAAALLTHEGVVRHGPAAESKEEGVQS